MGNFISNNKPSQDLYDKIINYEMGDFEEFKSIIDAGKGDKSDIFRAWKIASLYYFLLNLNETEHDIGVSQPLIKSKFQDIKSQMSEQFKLNPNDDYYRNIVNIINKACGNISGENNINQELTNIIIEI